MASDPGAPYDDEVTIDGAAIRPTVTWGINPGQSVYVDERLPRPADVAGAERDVDRPRRSSSWASTAGDPIAGTRIDVAFVGSCTNARLSDLREAARVVRGHHVAPHVQGARRARLAGRARAPPSARGSIASSSRPASSGAAPAVRCAWR